MLTQLSGKISSYFIENNAIPADKREVYIYCFEILLSTLINFFAVIIIAVISGRIIETALFLIGFIPIRSTAGGYHADTHFRCFLILMVTYTAFILLLNIISEGSFLLFNAAFMSISLCVIFLLAPLESENKPLTNEEKHHFKKLSRLMVLGYAAVVFLIFIIAPHSNASLCISFGVLTPALSLVASKLKLSNGGSH